MISTWRRRRASRRAAKERVLEAEENGDLEIRIPNHFRCPISLELMKDPVTLLTGITYDRESIETWIEAGNFTCPITNQVLRSLEPIPNHSIRRMIQDWCVVNHSYGIERIPTPKIPISSIEVSEILSNVVETGKREDQVGCRDLVARIKASLKESERNRRSIVGNGMGSVISAAFEIFSKADFDENIIVLEEILSTLTLIFPLDEDARAYLQSPPSLRCMVWFLKSGDLSVRRNSVLVLKEIISSNPQSITTLGDIDGSLAALVKLIKEPIAPTASKASLMIIYHMVSPPFTNERIIGRYLELNLVFLLLEMLVDCERSICERALGALDGICNSKEGREKAYEHALTMPVLVKKILRVSDLATEFSVSILWKLSKDERGEVIVEALQLGAFQKLLLLLQVGCGDSTKMKATELLKLLNLQREKLECIDSLDFKDLKRPF